VELLTRRCCQNSNGVRNECCAFTGRIRQEQELERELEREQEREQERELERELELGQELELELERGLERGQEQELEREQELELEREGEQLTNARFIMNTNLIAYICEKHSYRGDSPCPKCSIALPAATLNAVPFVHELHFTREQLRDWFAGQVMHDTRLAEDISQCDDSDLLDRFGTEDEKENGFLCVSRDRQSFSNIELRLKLEARARARIRYNEADAMLKAREEVN